MNFGKIIHLSILFVIAWLFFIIARRFILHDIFIPSLHPALKVLWNCGLSFGQFIFYAIMIVVVILWVIWNIVNRVVPKFFRKIIRWPFSPFKELDRSGLFRLLDRLFGIIFSRGTISNRLESFAESLLYFMKDSGTMLKDEAINELSSRVPNIIDPVKNSAKEKDQSTYNDMDDNSRDINISADDMQKIEEQYQQCLEEKIKPITDSMPFLERNELKTKNSMASATCKLNKIKASFDLISTRL